MMNVGKVSIKGMDVASVVIFNPLGQITIGANVSYTWQQALDVTDATSATYKTQLPYTPEHSGSAGVQFGYKRYSLNYNVLASSYRYNSGIAIPENIVQGWSNHDVSIGYSIDGKQQGYKFLAEFNNIGNTQYEVIRYYPMPGFNYRVGVTVTFKNNQKL